MRGLSADAIAGDLRVIEAKRLVLEALADHQKRIVGVRSSNPDLRTEYSELVPHFGELRGSPLFFPYLGSGFGNRSLVELADGSVKYDFITGIGVHFFGHGNLAIVGALLDAALTGTVMQGNLQQDAVRVRRRCRRQSPRGCPPA